MRLSSSVFYLKEEFAAIVATGDLHSLFDYDLCDTVVIINRSSSSESLSEPARTELNKHLLIPRKFQTIHHPCSTIFVPCCDCLD